MSSSDPAPIPVYESPAFALLRAVTFSMPDWECRYVGIADHIRACVDVTPNTYDYRLPRHEEMAAFYGVSVKTIGRAMKHLSVTGTVRVLTTGTFVITEGNIPDA